MKYKYIHPANCGFKAHGVYTKSDVVDVFGDRADEMIGLLFEPIEKEIKVKKEIKQTDKKTTSKK